MSFASILTEAVNVRDNAPRGEWIAAWKQFKTQCEPEIERLANVLRPLIPRLHVALKGSHGEQLQTWIGQGSYEGCTLVFEDSKWAAQRAFEHFVEDAGISIDVTGFDGWCFGENDTERWKFPDLTDAVLQPLTQLLESRKHVAIQQLITDILDGTITEERHEAAWVVYGILENGKQSEEIKTLWMLEAGEIVDSNSEWLLLPSEDLTVDPLWRHIESELPQEVIELLNCKVEI